MRDARASTVGRPWVSPVGMGHDGGGWGIFMMLVWGAIIVGIVFLIRYLIHLPGGTTSAEDALDILKKRYAKGEIEKAVFEEKKKDLTA